MERPDRLSATFARNIKQPGRYSDTGGLSLLVKTTKHGDGAAKSWSQRLRVGGKPVNIGLGPWPAVSLADARKAANDNRRSVAQGIDPRKQKETAPTVPTFAQAAEKVIAMYSPTWKDSGRSEKIWRSSLEQYAYPKLGRMLVSDVRKADILDCLMPIWVEKHDTARKLKTRISRVMRWAVAQDFREDDPAGPALNTVLPKVPKVKEHHKALHHSELAGAIETIRDTGAWHPTKLCFEFLALTAVRSGEARLATWDEINEAERVWILPPEHTKIGLEHRVPLSTAALDVLGRAKSFADGTELVFPSERGKAMSDSTVSKLVRENGVPMVPHGLRSTFRDWCAENGVSREVAEACLAHVVGGVEGAYFRSDLFQRRAEVMEYWGNYLNPTKTY